VADFPARPEFRQGLARIHSDRAAVLNETARSMDAEAAYTTAIVLRKQLVLDFPARTDFRQDLATSENDLGVIFANPGPLRDAEAHYAEALNLRRHLAADFPNMPDMHNQLAGTLVNLARIWNVRRDFAAARQLLHEGLLHHQAALRANPRHPTYRQFYRSHLETLIIACAGGGERAAALEAGMQRRDLGWDPAGDAYEAACWLAQCVLIAAKNEKSTEKQRQSDTEFYADQAMAMVQRAIAKGYTDAAHLRKDVDLDPL